MKKIRLIPEGVEKVEEVLAAIEDLSEIPPLEENSLWAQILHVFNNAAIQVVDIMEGND